MDPVRRLSACLASCLAALPLILTAQTPRVRIDPKPILIVAATAEDGSARFGSAAWATRLATGAIAVADLAEANVRVIAADGGSARSLGQRGSGPGDYQRPLWIGRCAGDSIMVWDMGTARATFHAPTAEASAQPRTWTAAELRGSMYTACSRTGAMAFLTAMRPRNDLPPIASGETPQGGQYAIVRMGATVRIVDAAGATRAELPPMGFGEFITGRLTSTSGFGGFPRPLGNSTSYTFVGDRLVVASADSGDVVGYEVDGREAFRFRVPPTGKAAMPADYQRAMGPAFAMLPARGRESAVAFVTVVPPPVKVPPFWRVLGDPAGLIWLVVSAEGAAQTVLRTYTTAGVMVGEHTVPGAFSPFEVGRDYLLGRRENEDGEQEVVVLRVTRN